MKRLPAVLMAAGVLVVAVIMLVAACGGSNPAPTPVQPAPVKQDPLFSLVELFDIQANQLSGWTDTHPGELSLPELDDDVSLLYYGNGVSFRQNVVDEDDRPPHYLLSKRLLAWAAAITNGTVSASPQEPLLSILASNIVYVTSDGGVHLAFINDNGTLKPVAQSSLNPSTAFAYTEGPVVYDDTDPGDTKPLIVPLLPQNEVSAPTATRSTTATPTVAGTSPATPAQTTAPTPTTTTVAPAATTSAAPAPATLPKCRADQKLVNGRCVRR